LKKILTGISLNLILLSIVSFLTDISSEMILPILPFYIVSLGGAGVAVGLIGGLSDSVASILKVISGFWSDRIGKRKPFVFWGYFSSALAKLFFPFARSWPVLLVLRPIERIGKGLRDAPRDALIASSTSADIRGKVFGFHRAADTLGAVFGAGLAFLLYGFLKLEFRPILLISALLAFLALLPLFFVSEKKNPPPPSTKYSSFSSFRDSLTELPEDFKHYLTIATIFAFANFTYMFFILRAKNFFIQVFTPRLSIIIPVLLYVWYNIFYSLFSLPAGVLSDRIGRKKMLISGYLVYALTCLGFIVSNSLGLFILFFALYGTSYALVEGNQRAYASDFVSEEKRGLALGAFHTVVSLAALPSGIVVGLLWNYDPSLPFLYGSILSLVAVISFLFLK